ncbi:MAG: phosphoribosylglycinamide formyltransferase [Ferruginibacter sp.]
MFKKLQQKWGVKGMQFFLILCTFAVTGTFTAWVSKAITGWVEAEKYSFLWWGLKTGVLLIGYQIFILVFGFSFGQFRFFWQYEKKILQRLGLINKEPITRLAIMASGNGTNAEKIVSFYKSKPRVIIELIISNNEKAGVLDTARENAIETFLVKKGAATEEELLALLKKKRVDLIILAGYLWKIPPGIIVAFPKKIINIHPALLPKFGGHGMYGQHVHSAVINGLESESGITIHYVDEIYDNGEIIFQQKLAVEKTDTPASLAKKIQLLEHYHYPRVIDSLIKAKATLKPLPQKDTANYTM